MQELKPCPFCGGKAKPSIRNAHKKEYTPSIGGYRKMFVCQVICNKCHGRGKPVRFMSEKWGEYMNVPYLEQKADIEPWVKLAIDYWNGRTKDEQL